MRRFLPRHSPRCPARRAGVRRVGLAGVFWLALGLLAVPDLGARPAPPLTVATFRCDVTPPLGHPLCGGWIKPLEAVDDPLLAKGVILTQGTDRFVLCAVDWCLLQTEAHDLFQRKLAAAAGIPPSRVALHTVHQHNAPIADVRAEQLLRAQPGPPAHLDLEFMDTVTDRVAQSLRAALDQAQPVTHVGSARARVEQFASNRRVRLADGAIHVRYSATRDPALQAAPEGLIDPWLRTVTLFQDQTPLVRLHYYASHPQSYYGDGRATADTVGLAREWREQEEHVPQIYFTGCAGNITAGKYNDGTPRAREALTGRLLAAMRQTGTGPQNPVPVGSIHWRQTAVPFALRAGPEHAESRVRAALADPAAAAQARLVAALDLAWIERWQRQPTITLSALDLGPVTLLHLPAEAFVEFQLYAQALRPDRFVAVAAYGESGPGYICTDLALTQGGYEPTASRVGPPSEFHLKQGIAALLGTPATPPAPPFYPDKLHLLAWRDPAGVEHPVASPADWAQRRAHIIQSFLEVAGEPPVPPPVGLPEFRILEDVAVPTGRRQKILITATPAGPPVPAFLFLPNPTGQRHAAVLCLHQTTPAGKAEPAGLTGDPNLQAARELAEHGFVTLAPDYPNFGEYTVDPYALGYASATQLGIVNHRRALDLLQALPMVNPDRLGAWGHSLGGHNALFLALLDERVKVVVTSCGFNAFLKYYHGDLTGWSHRGYFPRIAERFGKDPLQMPFDFTEVLAALAPRPVFIHAPRQDANFEVSGVHDAVCAAQPVYRVFSAELNLVARHPEGGHDFPPAARAEAIEWLRRVL